MFDRRISRIAQNHRQQFFISSNAVMIFEILIRQLFFRPPKATNIIAWGAERLCERNPEVISKHMFRR